MKLKSNHLIFWAPRILGILFILFISFFSLDTFGQASTFWETVIAFLIHNIPAIILAVLLVLAWKNEALGAIAFTFAGLFYIVLIGVLMLQDFQLFYITWILVIAGPALIIGILFYLGWRRKIQA